MNIPPLFLILFRIIACHPVKKFPGQTAVSVIASGEPIGGSAGLNFYCNLGKMGRTVVGNNDPSFGIDSVITAVIVHKNNPFIFSDGAGSDFLLLFFLLMLLGMDKLFPGGINVGLDFPKSLGFCPDCFELSVGCIVLLFQCFVLCFQYLAVGFTVRELLGDDTPCLFV